MNTSNSDADNFLPVFVIKYLCTVCDKSPSLDSVITEIKTRFSLPDEQVVHTLEAINNKTLDEVFAVGFSSIKDTILPKKQTEQQQQQQQALIDDTTIFAPEIESKIVDYEKTLEKKNFFSGTEAGSDAHKAKQQQARKFYLSNLGKGTASAEQKTKAEEFKLSGNTAFAEQSFESAIAAYTKAIEHDHRNPIYYANRAAVFISLEKYSESICDCLTAILLDSKYTKAYTRLGTSFLQLGNNDKAIAAFRGALQLEPDNTIAIDGIKAAETPTLSQTPNIASMLNNPELQNTLNGMFGSETSAGLSNMMSQPGVSEMVGNMMNNPQIMGMASNFASAFLNQQQNAPEGQNCNQQ